jgi:release factor glutamine methyltransferase
VTLDPAMRLNAALRAVETALEAGNIPDARREARLLLLAATGLSLGELIASPDRPLLESAARLTEFTRRRLAHEPLSRILGRREFLGLEFVLSPDTLDPRPETEHLVEATAAALRDLPAPRVLDLGTGSGAILIALATLLPRMTGLGIDIAPGAVDAARANAKRHCVDERLSFAVGDLFATDPGSRPFDAILSNPPYIAAADLAGLMPEVRLHDPVRALDGGADGLDFYRRIIADAPAYLAPKGLIGLEIGAGQASDVLALLLEAGFAQPLVIRDYAGIERVILARAPEQAQND